ncbi:MAG: AAA domain-containing protein [Bacteroidia bacterium]|nr:AAA domain-containing protein [Bacteroidia bacterium]
MTSTEKIAHLQELLKIERAEDLRIYQNTVLKRSLKERIKKGVTWYPVMIKKMYFGLGERLTIELDRADGGTKTGSFQTGSVVSLFGNAEDQPIGKLTGVISMLKPKEMKISLSIDNAPDWLSHTKLGVDLDFDDKTYQEMNQALGKVKDPQKNERLKELREVLIGDSKPNFFNEWNVFYHNPDLNPSQNKAVQQVLEAKDVAIIHGPPGTGKTTTLVQAIKETILREHQVLVCAPSNTAVDLLTLKCLEQGMDVVRLGNPARVDETLLSHTLDGAITNHHDYPSLKKLRKDAEQARKKAAKYKRKFGNQEYQKRKELFREARELRAMANQWEGHILHQIINNTQVITATLTGAAASVLGSKRFHTLFIDEAGQALEPSCWIPILRANRVIMAGDHCQLPPTVKSREADKGGLSRTLFEQVIEEKEGVAVMLDQQYRMNEKIMAFSGRKFYDNKLIADKSVKHHLVGENFTPVEFIDTAGCGFDEKKNPETLSTGNPDEANLILKHLALMCNQIEKECPEVFEDEFKIGIIAPYKEQVKIIKAQLDQIPMLHQYSKRITVNTVDGFQGQERDVIYISLVRSNQKGEIGFLQDIRRMNVALTRAKKKLVLVGDSATLGNHPFYEDFLNYVEGLEAYKTAWEYMEV